MIPEKSILNNNSYIEISKSAIRGNLQLVRKIIGPDVRISSVVKANAYGHGIENFVPIALDSGIDHFSVFSAREAQRVMNSIKNKDADIMIMGFIDDHDMEFVLRNRIEFYVFNLHRLLHAIDTARKLKIKANIHIELETGMNRTGIEKRDLKRVISILQSNSDYLVLKGLCTHYAGAESIANHVRVQKQISRFNRTCRELKAIGIVPEMKHTACSAAALTYDNTRMDMVRIGIAQYGFWPSDETRIHYLHKYKDKTDPLKRAISWKSSIMTIKHVAMGEFVSYGTTYLAQENKVLAIIPVGYSHGYSRTLSNQGKVLVRGQRCGVIGMVNMNMLVADVTTVDGVSASDEVVIIGNQKELSISVHSFSQLSDQLNYELLTRLPAETERTVVD